MTIRINNLSLGLDEDISILKKKASKKWNEKNREHRSYLTSRSSARSFIRNKATLDDLIELEQLINDRRKQLDS